MANGVTQIKKSLYLFKTVNEAGQFFVDLADNRYVIQNPVVYCTGNNTVYYRDYNGYPDTDGISALKHKPIVE